MDYMLVPDIKGGSINAADSGNSAGKVDFFIDEQGRMVIDHVYVNPDYRGGTVGRNLVEEAVKYARENEYKVMPWCSYAKSVFERSEWLQDVLESV